MGSDAAFIGVMVGARSGQRVLARFIGGNQARGPSGDGGANAATTPSWAFQSSLMRRRLACLHALLFPHFVFCGDRGPHSSHPLSKKHGSFIQNSKKEEKNGAVAMGWVVA